MLLLCVQRVCVYVFPNFNWMGQFKIIIIIILVSQEFNLNKYIFFFFIYRRIIDNYTLYI